MSYTLDIPRGAFHTVTAPEHCAWPNLTLMPGEEIGAVIHNQPSHAGMVGDVELWVSDDAGETWQMRSQVSDHEPGHVRMNVAAGLNQDDELIVLCSGWNLDRKGRQTRADDVDEALVYISSDGGHTWETAGEMPPPPGTIGFTPFGDINIAGDSLVVAGYTREFADGTMMGTDAHIYRSDDRGRTWKHITTIDDGDHNETDLLVQDDGPWLASVRVGDRAKHPGYDRHKNEPYIVLYTSEDEGESWQQKQRLTRPSQHTSHLLELDDGRVLLSYGSRMSEMFGVVARISEDQGETWSQPFKLVGDFLSRDCGYPSDVQVGSGDIVTAYYSESSPWCQRYHMGVLRWNPDMIDIRMPGKS
ncbi:MAG: sialidase family protein [Armatimonadota bacterium]